MLTKLDGTAKGGVALAIRSELDLPIRYVGLGEQADDLAPFDADAFTAALFADGGVDRCRLKTRTAPAYTLKRSSTC